MNSRPKTLFAIHVPSKTNIGDAASTPIHYFRRLSEQFSIKVLSIGEPNTIEQIEAGAPVIIGGGGLLAGKPAWDQAILAALRRSDRVIGWGIGLNRSLRSAALSPAKLPPYAGRFLSLGIRDQLPGTRWVPCASAMSSVFDLSYSVVRKYGIFLHSMRVERVPADVREVMDGSNAITNQGGFQDFPAVVKFLGESECILTNSYHGMYWGILLNKPVVVFDVFSEKFHHTKWKPEFLEVNGDLAGALKRAKRYDSALNEAREANLSFFEEVYNQLTDDGFTMNG